MSSSSDLTNKSFDKGEAIDTSNNTNNEHNTKSNGQNNNDNNASGLTAITSNQSLGSSISSSSLNGNQSSHPIPVPYQKHIHDEDEEQLSSNNRRFSSSSKDKAGRSYSNSSRSSSQFLSNLRNSLSRTSTSQSNELNRNQLTRLSTKLSVKDIYGDMNEDEINLQRVATKTTILTTLSNRVQNVINDDERISSSDSSKGDKFNNEGIENESESKNDYDNDDDKSNKSEVDNEIYNDIPDVSVPLKNFGGEFSSIDPELVTWEGEDDPDYPRNWSVKKRWFQTVIVAFYSFLSPMSSSILSPAIDDIGESLHMNGSVFLKSFSVSIMVLAWALGPLIIAPLSESDRVGRRPVLNISIWVGAIFNLCCGFAKTTAQLCIMRFIGGLCMCSPLNVGAGTLADIWRDDERNMAMGFYSVAPTLGPVIAPVISSFIVTGLDWHWCFYILAIFNFAVAIFGTIFFKETYSPKLLRIKCNKLKKETGNENLHTIYQIADGETTMGKFYVTFTRPLQLIIGHPMVTGLGSFMAFVYGFMYLMIVTFPKVFKVKYGYSVNIAGLMYLSMGVGYVIGIIFWCIMIDKIYKYKVEQSGGIHKPEYRLYCLVIAGMGCPVGLIIYGWGAHFKVMWLLPCFGAGIFSFFMVCVFQAIQLYLIQMNNRFAASSVAAAAVFRSFFGFAFPLFANNLYNKLNYGWGNTLCALLLLLLGVPFPLFCLKYGEPLRNWANKRFELKQAKRDAINFERLKKMNENKLV